VTVFFHPSVRFFAAYSFRARAIERDRNIPSVIYLDLTKTLQVYLLLTRWWRCWATNKKPPRDTSPGAIPFRIAPLDAWCDSARLFPSLASTRRGGIRSFFRRPQHLFSRE